MSGLGLAVKNVDLGQGQQFWMMLEMAGEGGKTNKGAQVLLKISLLGSEK